MTRLVLTNDHNAVDRALTCFPDSYHRDFIEVREKANAYLSTKGASRPNARALAESMRHALANWGAGQRRAPSLVREGLFFSALQSNIRQARLQALAQLSIDKLSVQNGIPRTTNPVPTRIFDRILLSTLRDLSTALFVDNTNVTYPMKALLLITGQMPAFDSQVRRGLTRAGIVGFSSTRFLLPAEDSSAAAKRITKLPVALGDLWRDETLTLRGAIARTGRIGLESEPGRVFDMLLFMQGRSHEPIMTLRVAARG